MEVADGETSVDAVVRMQNFKAKYPHITFKPPGRDSAYWEVRDGDELVATGYWLFRVMDKLAEKYS